MSNLKFLKADLADHLARREQLRTTECGSFIKRAGYTLSGVIASYDKIIASIEDEIVKLSAPKTKKQKNAKKI
jgi:hypothetical protein